ncbi:MAG: chemotaxis protein CheW [Gemmataceae bacterium]
MSGSARVFDWNEIKDRLRSKETPEEASARARRVLEERARKLAQVTEATTAPSIEVLIFKVGAECFGLETSYVREVVALPTLTPMPGAPDSLVGLTNLRGQIVACFELQGSARTHAPRFGIMVGQRRVEFGIVADEVDAVACLTLESIHRLAGDGNKRDWLRGLSQGTIAVIDAERLRDDPRFLVNQSDDA